MNEMRTNEMSIWISYLKQAQIHTHTQNEFNWQFQTAKKMPIEMNDNYVAAKIVPTARETS